MKYSDKLKDPRWQKKRLEIFQRDDWGCVRCQNDKITLHIHHKEYIAGKDPWEYLDSDLETLCELCHAKENSKIIQIETFLKTLNIKFAIIPLGLYDQSDVGYSILLWGFNVKWKDIGD